MQRLKNWFNGYDFENNESIKKKKGKILGYVKDEYNKILKEQEDIKIEELDKKFDTDLNQEVKKYIENEKMNDFFYNEKIRYINRHNNFLKEKAKKEEEKAAYERKIDR